MRELLNNPAILMALGTALLTLSAKVSLPLPYVPMTLQTLVVLMIGAAYGWRLGAATVIAYLAEGAIGLPVFAGPVGGLAPLVGPTAGYLYGFVLAAFATGWLSQRGWDHQVVWLFVAMGIGHVLILGTGFAWLAFAAATPGSPRQRYARALWEHRALGRLIEARLFVLTRR